MVDKFSSPKLILPLESVIEPLAKVRLPIDEPVVAVNTPQPRAPQLRVPVVDKFSSLNVILPLESVIEPLAKVRFPIEEPVPVITPVEVIAPQPSVPNPEIFLLPSTTNALLAVTVPAVTLSKTPISAVVIVVPSNVIDVSPVMVPVTDKAPRIATLLEEVVVSIDNIGNGTDPGVPNTTLLAPDVYSLPPL